MKFDNFAIIDNLTTQDAVTYKINSITITKHTRKPVQNQNFILRTSSIPIVTASFYLTSYKSSASNPRSILSAYNENKTYLVAVFTQGHMQSIASIFVF